MDWQHPSPDELLQAHRTLAALSHSTYDMGIRDRAGSPAWDGLVEGRRMLAVTTAALGQLVDPRYAETWEAMLDEA